MAYASLASEATPAALRRFLENVAARREFRLGLDAGAAAPAAAPANGWPGFGGRDRALVVPGLRLTGAQTFVRDFAGPDTDYTRLLVKWQTGAGKSIGAIAICHEFADQYRRRAALGDRPPSIVVLGFTTRETILEDMLRFPEFGFAAAAEIEELQRLRAVAAAAAAANSGSTAAIRQLAGFLGVLRRRITDRARGGYYQFYGYKEFANRLFRVTRSAASRGFESDALFARYRAPLSAKSKSNYKSEKKSFGERLAEAVRRGDIEIDQGLLDSLRGGLLVCDEIHNVYNIMEPNNYGLAIQYVLDSLGDAAPRAVFMSATPVTGSAAEVVDLLNLLVPRSALPGGAPLCRSDFFMRTRLDSDESALASRLVVSRLRPDALDRIGRLAAGRVSFLLDADTAAYPTRTFVGTSLPNIPYIKFTPCVLSPLHARTLAREQAEASAKNDDDDNDESQSDNDNDESQSVEATRGLSASAYTLNDMVFPNPDETADYGLYRSSDTMARLSAAPASWLQTTGITMDAVGGRSKRTLRMPSGPWLQADRLATYSSKYSRLIAELIQLLRIPNSGKIMIYHHRVHMSGVLLIAEVLRMNGFADELGDATDNTLCAECGVARAAHGETRSSETRSGETHKFVAARFALAHSDIDRAEMLRSISRFNSPENLHGGICRVLIGSKIIREGLNFRAVRQLFITSMPTDYPTLMQVFGRVVRKNSHAELPLAERNVQIRVLVGVIKAIDARGKAQSLTPELQRYSDKGQEFLVIQAVERALHVGAVDGFVNYPRIRAALDSADSASIDALPYAPALGPDEARALVPTSVTFDAYGHGPRLVAATMAVCRALFAARPVWTFEDLWAAVHAGAARGSGAHASAHTEESLACALARLERPSLWGSHTISVLRADKFYIASDAISGSIGNTLDVEAWLRKPAAPRAMAHVSVQVGAYVQESRASVNFEVHLQAFESKYLSGVRALELSLLGVGGAFHVELLRRLIVAAAPVTSDDAAVADMYCRFRIGVTAAAAQSAGVTLAGKQLPAGKRSPAETRLVGYVTPDAVVIYDGNWRSLPLVDFKIGRRHRENGIVVGFVADAGAAAKFKLRPPLQLRAAARRQDNRTIERGAVCETRSREELDSYARRLRAQLASAPRARRLAAGVTATGDTATDDTATDDTAMGWPESANSTIDTKLSFAARFDRAAGKRFPSAGELCDAIRLHLLALEEIARSASGGLTDGTRWVYLFPDRPPNVASTA